MTTNLSQTVNTLMNGIITVILLGFMFNEVPHIAGLYEGIEPEKRRELVKTYGSWAVGRAEAVCPAGDEECVEREAARLLGTYRRGYTYYE